MSDHPIIEVSDLSTSFGDHVVHENISFSVNRGEIVSLIGASGTGKTVLLKQVMSLWSPYRGSIKLFGRELSESNFEELSKLRRKFGVVFQNSALFSSLTTGENIAVPLLENLDLKEDAIEQLVRMRLSMVGLEPHTAIKPPSELSGGMKKRAALARALVLEPELLFLDEPTSGLDPVLAREMDALIQTLAESLRLTVLVVTHDVNTVCDMSDRVIALGEGRVLADGSVNEVRRSGHGWIQKFFSDHGAGV